MMQEMIYIDKSSSYAGGPGGTRTPNQAVMSGYLFLYLSVIPKVYLSLKSLNSHFVPLFQGQSRGTRVFDKDARIQKLEAALKPFADMPVSDDWPRSKEIILNARAAMEEK